MKLLLLVIASIVALTASVEDRVTRRHHWPGHRQRSWRDCPPGNAKCIGRRYSMKDDTRKDQDGPSGAVDDAKDRWELDRQRLQELRKQHEDNPAYRGSKVIDTWDGSDDDAGNSRRVYKPEAPQRPVRPIIPTVPPRIRLGDFGSWHKRIRKGQHHGCDGFGCFFQTSMRRAFIDRLPGLFWEHGHNFTPMDTPPCGTEGSAWKSFHHIKPSSRWQGPNVCKTKEESIDEDDGNVAVQMECTDTEAAFVCTTRWRDCSGTIHIEVETHECCPGYERATGHDGCVKAVPLEDLMTTADKWNGTQMVRILKDLELADVLAKDNYTLFLPTDKALSTFRTLYDLENVIVVDLATLEMAREFEDIINTHIVEGLHKSRSLNDEELLDTRFNESKIRLNHYTIPRQMMTANCVPLKSMDHMALNGVIHVLDGVLPIAEDTVFEVVASHPKLTIMEEVVMKALSIDELDQDGQFTLFAPSDEAFQALDLEVLAFLRNDMDHYEMKAFLKNHLLENVICSSVVSGERVRMRNARRSYLYLVKDDADSVFVNGAKLLEMDIMGANGVIHIIDQVLFPTELSAQIERIKKVRTTKTEELLEETGLCEAIKEMDNITVFLPTDEAIEDYLSSSKKNNSEELKNLLRFHITMGRNQLKDFDGLRHLDSLVIDKSIIVDNHSTCRETPFHYKAQCASVVRGDMSVCGQVAHSVDQVLQPSAASLMDALEADPNLSITAQLINKTGLGERLRDTAEGPFTVLAPQNAAWERLVKQVPNLERRLENLEALEVLLEKHILSGHLCCSEVQFSNRCTGKRLVMKNLNGQRISFTRDNKSSVHVKDFMDGTEIARCDIMASNGVIHTVENTLWDSFSFGSVLDSVFDNQEGLHWSHLRGNDRLKMLLDMIHP